MLNYKWLEIMSESSMHKHESRGKMHSRIKGYGTSAEAVIAACGL